MHSQDDDLHGRPVYGRAKASASRASAAASAAAAVGPVGRPRQPAASALAAQGNAIAAVYAWDPATQSWTHYFPGLPAFVNSLATLEQGRAYWFLAGSGGAIIIE